jgi:hypothetical protein
VEDYSFIVNPSNSVLIQGSTVANAANATIAPLYGYANNVASAGCTPTNFNCSFTTVNGGSGSPAVSISNAATTPVGVYSLVLAATDNSAPAVNHTSQIAPIAVQCTMSVQQVVPSMTPAAGTTPNQYSLGVSVAAGGNACPYGSIQVVGGTTPGAVAGDGTVVTTIVTGASGTATATQSQPLTFEISAPGATPLQGQVNVPFFDATQPTSVNKATMLVEVEAVPQPVALANGIAGQKTGNATVTQTLSGTLTITQVGTAGSFCGVVDSNGNPDATGNNFGVTCLWNASTPTQVTVNLQLTGAAMNHESRARLGIVFALFLPGVVFVGAGFSVFGPRRWRTAQQRFTVLLGILLLISLLVVIPACGGGFNATFLKSGNGGNFTVTLLGYTSGGGTTVSGIEIFTIPVSAQ